MNASSAVQVVAITWLPVNRPPVGSVPPLISPQDATLVSYIIASDLDNDTVVAYISSLPGQGILRQYNGSNITTVPTLLTDASLRFMFTPAYLQSGSPYANFSFYLFDGKNYSSVVVASITITPVNYPPVAINSTLSLLQSNSTTIFTLQATDIETPNNVSAIILSLPPTSVGTLTDSLGNPLYIGEYLLAPRSISFTPFYLWYGVTSFQFVTNDGTQNSTNVATVVVNVTHVNHAPTTVVSYGTAVRTISLPINISAYDIDIGDNITVTISGYSSGIFYLPSGLLFPSAPFILSGSLTMTSSGVVSTSVSFVAPILATGTNYANFSYYVMDQVGAQSSVTTVMINVGNNHAPVAVALPTINVTQDFMSSSIVLSGTDVDVADSPVLQVVIYTLPTKGTLYFQNGTAITSTIMISTTSTVTITYQTFQRGTDQFVYLVRDPLKAASLPVTVAISITNTNHAPVASWLGGCSGNENSVITISQMTAVDPDPDDTTLALFIAAPPVKGVLTQTNGSTCSSYPCLVSSGTMFFTPLPYDFGIPYANFTFYAVDTHGMRSILNVTGIISVIFINYPPVVINITAVGYENTNITISLNVTDVDTPVSLLNITIVSLPPTSLGVLVNQQGATVTAGSIISLQTLQFIPVQYANGNATITFRASDQISTTAIASISLVVIPVTQAPICSTNLPNPIMVPKQSSTNVLLNNWDPDSGETYTYYLASYQAADGTGVLVGPNGVISASTVVIGSVPSSSSFVTSLTVTYNVTTIITSLNISFIVFDGTYNSSVCVVKLVVIPDIAPIAIPPPLTTTLQGSMSSAITLNGTDADDDWRTARISIVNLPQNGQLFVNSLAIITTPSFLPASVFTVTYNPNLLFYGNDTFSFIVTDQSGVHSNVQSANIAVVHVNHSPTISVSSLSTLENMPVNFTTVYINDVDVGDVLTLIIASPPSQGNFSWLNGTTISNYPASVSGSFAFTYNPAQYAFGQVTFNLYAFDGMNVSSTVQATINVIAVNNAPFAQNQQIPLLENAAASIVTLIANDVDNTTSQLSACVVSLPLSSLGSVTYFNGTTVSVGDCIPYPRNVTFTPAAYSYGIGLLVYYAWDGLLLSVAPGIANITITHVNHAPTASAASTVVAMRTVPLAIPIAARDVDVGDLVTVTLATFVGGGTLSATSGGAALTIGPLFSGNIQSFGATLNNSLYYTAPANAVGVGYAKFTFYAADQIGASSSTVTVTISIASNNAPVAQSVVLLVTQDGQSAPITLTGTDVDVADAGSLKIYISGLPTKGTLMMSSNVTSVPTQVTGPITYYTTQRGSDQFFFYVVDLLNASSAVMLVPINITAVNHAPVISFASTSMAALENVNTTITLIAASDPDGDIVTVYLSSLPTMGSFYQMDGTLITAVNTSITDTSYRIVYVPVPVLSNQITSFSFFGNDGVGAANSITPIISVNINITHVNRPPVAYTGVIVKDYGPSNFSVTPNVTDADTPGTQLTIIIQSVPVSSIGVLTTLNGTPITAGQVVAYPFNMTFAPNVTAVGSSAFIFYASDGLNVSAPVSFTIMINAALNHPPIASAPSSYTAVHGVPIALNLNVHDDDFHEIFTFVVSATMNGAGTLTNPSLVPLSPPVFNVSVLQNQWLYITTAVIIFTPPLLVVGQSGYLTLQYTVYDSFGASSNSAIVVSIAPNSIPVATFTGTITMQQESVSPSFALTGFDNDIHTN